MKQSKPSRKRRPLAGVQASLMTIVLCFRQSANIRQSENRPFPLKSDRSHCPVGESGASQEQLGSSCIDK